MRKIFSLALGFALAASPAIASAQAIDPDPVNPPGICPIGAGLLTGFTVLRCVGFYSGNVLQYGTGANIVNSGNFVESYQALNLLGYNPGTTQYSVLEKFNLWNGTDDFTTTLRGVSIIGFHWGGGSQFGNSTGFFEVNFGQPGTKNVDIAPDFRQGISNAAILYVSPPTTTVPEPSTYALMGAGLAGIAVAARRRRKTA